MTAFQSEDAFAELYYSKFIGIVFFHFVLIPVIILGVSWSLTPRSIDTKFELPRFNFLDGGGQTCDRSNAYMLESTFWVLVTRLLLSSC